MTSAMNRWWRLACMNLLLAVLLLGNAAYAYPDKPVRLVVGFAPGGSDISARVLAQKLTQLWGQQVFVENRPGAAGNLAADFVSRADPDGYTVLLFVNSYTINTTVYRNLRWDLLKDFTAIGRYGVPPQVVVLNDRLPAKTMGELLAYAKANPGKLDYGSAGVGTAPHLAMELLAQQTDLNLTHVAYKGSGASVTGLLTGEVHFAMGALSAFDAHIKSGRLRAIAVTSATRYAGLPEVPTVMESGVRDFDVDIWYGLLAPANLPAPIAKKLTEGLKTVLADPATQAGLRQTGVEPAFLGGQQMGELMQRDVDRWRDVAHRLKLTLD